MYFAQFFMKKNFSLRPGFEPGTPTAYPMTYTTRSACSPANSVLTRIGEEILVRLAGLRFFRSKYEAPDAQFHRTKAYGHSIWNLSNQQFDEENVATN